MREIPDGLLVAAVTSVLAAVIAPSSVKGAAVVVAVGAIVIIASWLHIGWGKRNDVLASQCPRARKADVPSSQSRGGRSE